MSVTIFGVIVTLCDTTYQCVMLLNGHSTSHHLTCIGWRNLSPSCCCPWLTNHSVTDSHMCSTMSYHRVSTHCCIQHTPAQLTTDHIPRVGAILRWPKVLSSLYNLSISFPTFFNVNIVFYPFPLFFRSHFSISTLSTP